MSRNLTVVSKMSGMSAKITYEISGGKCCQRKYPKKLFAVLHYQASYIADFYSVPIILCCLLLNIAY